MWIVHRKINGVDHFLCRTEGNMSEAVAWTRVQATAVGVGHFEANFIANRLNRRGINADVWENS